MNKLRTQEEWIKKQIGVLPAGGFGNFDPGDNNFSMDTAAMFGTKMVGNI